MLPVINEYWEKAEFPYELLPGLAELGIVGTTIRGYGCPGMSRKAAGMVAREMARVDGSMNTFLGVHSNLCMGALNLLGSPEQKERWLPPLASIEKTGAFALTEPDHGSDSVALETAPAGRATCGSSTDTNDGSATGMPPTSWCCSPATSKTAT